MYPDGDGARDDIVVAMDCGVELDSGGSMIGGEPARDVGCENAE
jgi:hypothetical protein